MPPLSVFSVIECLVEFGIQSFADLVSLSGLRLLDRLPSILPNYNHKLFEVHKDFFPGNVIEELKYPAETDDQQSGLYI